MPKQLPVLPRAGDVCSSTDSAQLLVPRTRPMAGTHVLAALVRVAEGPIGVPVSTQVVKHTAGGIFKVRLCCCWQARQLRLSSEVPESRPLCCRCRS